MRLRSIVAAAAVVAAVLLPAQAVFAAAPQATGDVSVQSWPGGEDGRSVIIISVTVPDSTKLPATVKVPVPQGVELDWVGEISGTDPSLDPTRTYTIEKGTGGDYVQLEISKYRVAQIEGTGPALAVQGGETSFAMTYTQTVPSDVVEFSLRLPAGVELKDVTPEQAGEPQQNDAGETLYTLKSKDMKPGDTQKVEAVYVPVGQAPAPAADSNVIVAVLAAAVVVAVIALALVLRTQGRRAPRS